MKEAESFNLDELRRFAIQRWPEHMGRTHGVDHWDRVCKFGQILYQDGADLDVIKAFAYLHDSERLDNGEDIDHGKRASKLIDTIRDTLLSGFSDEQIAKLKKACELHTVCHKTDDATINICFDADRMDLLRIHVMPLPKRMATRQGARLVANPDYMEWYKVHATQQ